MIRYRSFRNPDPPALVEVWNASFTGRGAVVLSGPLLLEYFVFSKPYFDPQGLIVAEDEGRIVGFAHAAFPHNEQRHGLDRDTGIICALGVLPSHRSKGVGTELLYRAEEYLQQRGATRLHAGSMSTENPFGFGLHGGSCSAGFLESDVQAQGFFEKHGYTTEATATIWQRRLDVALGIVDARFAAFRQRFEIHVAPLHTDWWGECVLGPIEVHDFRLVEKSSGQVPASCALWEMDTYSSSWQQYAVGVFHLEVLPEHRRQGIGKFLLTQILRHLQEQCFSLVEIQAASDNAAALGLLQALAFDQVDLGRRYQLQARKPGERGS